MLATFFKTKLKRRKKWSINVYKSRNVTKLITKWKDSGLLGDLDRYSTHGGCDVIKGEKWIANKWLTAPTKHSSHIKSYYDVGFD